MHSDNSLNKELKKSFSDYSELIETLAKVEYSRLSSTHLIDFSELINIGSLTVHTVLNSHQGQELNVSYMSTAIKWAIRNELRRRYRWYSLKNKPAKDAESSDKEELREAIYETILSIDELSEQENPTQIRDNSPNPEENVEFGELSSSIKRAIQKLPAREKAIIESRFFKGKKLRELSEEYKISSSRVSRVIQSGLDKIKIELQNENIV